MEIVLNFVRIQMEATSAHVNLITCLVLTQEYAMVRVLFLKMHLKIW